MFDTWCVYYVIGGAALITYGLRLGGLLLADRLPQSGRFSKFMNALPGTILLSLIVPPLLAAGLWGWIGAACTALVSRLTGNTFIAMILGVAIVAANRYFSG